MFICLDLDAVVGNHKTTESVYTLRLFVVRGCSSQRFAVSMHIQAVLLCCVMLIFSLVGLIGDFEIDVLVFCDPICPGNATVYIYL